MILRPLVKKRMDPSSPDNHGALVSVNDVYVDVGSPSAPDMRRIAENLTDQEAAGYVKGFVACRKLLGELVGV
jgi:hypothetical protein